MKKYRIYTMMTMEFDIFANSPEEASEKFVEMTMEELVSDRANYRILSEVVCDPEEI